MNREHFKKLIGETIVVYTSYKMFYGEVRILTEDILGLKKETSLYVISLDQIIGICRENYYD